jgi:hypothetical protein
MATRYQILFSTELLALFYSRITAIAFALLRPASHAGLPNYLGKMATATRATTAFITGCNILRALP